MGCGGACGGNCACATRKPSDPRRFGLKADPEAVLMALRGLQLEDPAGNVVIMTEEEFNALHARIDALDSEVQYYQHEAGMHDKGCDCGCP